MKYIAVNRSKSGFMLLEVLPAISLLLGIIVVGAKVLWMGHGLESGSRAQIERVRAFEAVWQIWRQSEGTVALARRSNDGEWGILDFPDTTWLPTGQRSDSLESYVWRRRQFQDQRGFYFWDVEIGSADIDSWSWWTRIYE